MRIVERVVDGDGAVLAVEPEPSRRVLRGEVARAVSRMMVGTTEYGTAHLGFHDRSNRPLLPGITVAGKTGSLNRPATEGPFLAYSWFVGFAPAERPEVAVAVLLGNSTAWHKKAHQVARQLLTAYFRGDAGDAPIGRRLAVR
jgi:cell division protein FtsI/penicillin-binding protein 2